MAEVRLVRIDKVGRVITGRTPSVASESLWGGALEFVTPGDIADDGLLRHSQRTLSDAGRLGAQIVPPHSVLFVGIGATLGKTAIVDREIAVNQQCHAVIVGNESDSLLLREILDRSGRLFWRRAGNGGMPILPKAAFEKIEIPWPASAARNSVSRAVALLDASFRKLERLIEAKRAFKRGLMQQLVTGQRRFPEFRNVPWNSSPLGNHVSQINRRNSGGLKLVLTASGEHGLVDQRKYFNRNVAGADLSKYHVIKRGEFAYNRSAMQGYPYGATKRLDEHDEGILSTLYLCFAIHDDLLNSDFLKHVFESGVLNRQLRPIVRVGARAHGLLNVTDNDFLAIVIPCPEIEEQKRIAALLNSCEKEVDLLAALREQIELYKRGLLSRLLSGEIKVPA